MSAPGSRRRIFIGMRSTMSTRRIRGIALVGVLWILVLLTSIAVALTRSVRSEVQVVGNTVQLTRASYAAQGGVELGVLSLLTQQSRQIFAQGSVQKIMMGDITIRIAAEDEAGKIDLNHASSPLLSALLINEGIDVDRAAAIADAIMDWRDPDDMRRLNGAEDADYRIAGRAHGAADRKFHSVDELQLVLGMNAELFDRLRPALTVYSGIAGANPDVASPQVIAAIAGAGQAQTSASGLSYTIHAEATMPEGITSRIAATVALSPGAGGKPYQILAWRQPGRPYFDDLQIDPAYAMSAAEPIR